jgi:hypothetical protein
LKLRPARSGGLDTIGGNPDAKDITAKPCCGKPGFRVLQRRDGADGLERLDFPVIPSKPE